MNCGHCRAGNMKYTCLRELGGAGEGVGHRFPMILRY